MVYFNKHKKGETMIKYTIVCSNCGEICMIANKEVNCSCKESENK